MNATTELLFPEGGVPTPTPWVGAWRWQLTTDEGEVDARWCQTQGIDPCNGPGQPGRWQRNLHPDDLLVYRHRLQELRSGTTARLEVEFRILTLDHRWLWILQRGEVTRRGPDGEALEAGGICIEIDQRKREENELRESESQLATALWGARAAFWRWHRPTDTRTPSALWFAMTGYTREQWFAVPNPWQSRLHPEDRARVAAKVEQFTRAAGTDSLEFEYRIRTARGGWKWILDRARVVEWDPEGPPALVMGVSLDIDAQKEAETRLRETEARLQTAMWGARLGLCETDCVTGTTRWFNDWCERVDVDPCADQNHVASWDENIHGDDVGEAQRRYFEHIAGKSDYYDAEYRIRTRSGGWLWIFERGRVTERDAEGRALRMVGVCMDIDSRRRQIEAGANFAVERLETALQIARGGVWEMDLGHREISYSDGYYRMLGVDAATGRATPHFWLHRVHPDDLEAVRAAFDDYEAGRSEDFEQEYRIRHESGRWLWMLDRSRAVTRRSDGCPVRIIGFAMDISTRRAAEEALRESEERFRLATAAVNGVIYESDLVSQRSVLHGVERLTGWGGPHAPSGLEAWLGIVHQDDRERVRAAIMQQRSWARSYDDLYYRLQRPDGSLMHVWHRGSYVLDAHGQPVRAIGLIEDVTARVMAEDALKRSEFRFRAVANLAPGFVFEGQAGPNPETDGRLVYASETFEPVMGCSFAEFLARGSWLSFCDAESEPRWLAALKQMRHGEPVFIELHGCTAAGREAWLRLQSVPVLDPQTHVRTGTIGVVHDITAAKEAELALRESQLVLQTITASSPTNLSLFDRDHRLVFTNYTLHGGPVEEIVGRRVEDFVDEPYASHIIAAIDEVFSTGEGVDSEGEMEMKGYATPRTYEARMRPVLSGGRVVGVVSNTSDVTELRSQQENLQLQARIIETIREGVVLLDRDGQVLLANPAMHALFGYASDSLAGRTFASLTALPAPAFARLLAGVLKDLDAGEAPQLEFEGQRADGGRLVASCIFAAIHIRGEPRIVAVLSDITERKHLEREVLQVATREQQRIGSDLHDGVGQQLTGIALLLKGLVPRLSRVRPSDLRGDVEQIVALVNDAIDSTRALARGLSPVPAADDGLALALEALASQTFQRHRVEVVLDNTLPEDQSFDDNTATHLYRIAQEALGNALRHGQPRRIRLMLRPEGGQIELVVRDDGIGFDRRAIQPSGLGLKIMRFRAQMIGGDLTVESAPGAGTTIRCHFPLAQS
jgi:PAS domain S-box-containing protein